MSRVKKIEHCTEGTKRFVSVTFLDKGKPEHFMDIEVRVDRGAVMLSCLRYDSRIFFPIEALPLIVEAVNLETGTSVTVNVSGPVFIGSGGDPFILRGNALLFAEAGDFGPGTSATLVVTSGTVTFRANVPGYTLQGRSRDLCAELA